MTDIFTVRTGEFEGPLDLLLTLIEEKKLSIDTVALSEVAESFLEYIKDKEHIPISSTAQFLVVASTLLLLKSFSLIPSLSPEKEEEEDIQDLEKRLLEYRKIRELSRSITSLFDKKRFYFSFGIPRLPSFSPDPLFSKMFFSDIMHEILSELPQKTELPEKEIVKVMTIEETMDRLISRIKENLSTSFHTWSGHGKNLDKQARVQVIVSFLALLELVKNEMIEARQENLYEDIAITQRA